MNFWPAVLTIMIVGKIAELLTEGTPNEIRIEVD